VGNVMPFVPDTFDSPGVVHQPEGNHLSDDGMAICDQ